MSIEQKEGMSDAIRGSRLQDIENPRSRPSFESEPTTPQHGPFTVGGAREGSTDGNDCLICFVVLNVCVICLVVYMITVDIRSTQG